MRIVVTGAAGFVGRHLLPLLREHQVIAIDSSLGGLADLEHVQALAGDFRNEAVLNAAFSQPCDAVVHLATVPGGAAEASPDLAWQVNVEGTRDLASRAMRGGAGTRFIFASSIAVLGSTLPAVVDDDCPVAPDLLYGAHKAMMEDWLATLRRRGDLQALSLRLSGVIARPAAPSGMKSAFLSNVFHALAAGDSFEMPVSPGATSWLSSVRTTAGNLAHAVFDPQPFSVPAATMTLPSLQVTLDDMVEEIARQKGLERPGVSYHADPQLEAVFGAQPPLLTPLADSCGFSRDAGLGALVSSALQTLS